jgi:hypothetical protein
MSTHDCSLCSIIQAAVAVELAAFDRLHESADIVGFRQLPPVEGEGVSEDDWMEFAVRRDEYERARTKRLRADNRFFDECPRCHFELSSARRSLEERRAELPWFGPAAQRETVRFQPGMRATGS